MGTARHGHRPKGRPPSPTYHSWTKMKNRCLCKTNHAYKDYGARGITVWPAWESFENFLADMGERPIGKSLERKNNELGYSPDNCVWATPKEQMRNRRNTKCLELDGVTKPLVQWAEEAGIDRRTISSRLRMGWDVRRAISTPARAKTWV